MFSLNIFIFRNFKIFLQHAFTSSSSSLSRRPPPVRVVSISIYAKQKKDDMVDVIFDESAALHLSDIISDFTADRFNYYPTLFTIPQLKCVCIKVRQSSTNTLVELVLTSLNTSRAKIKLSWLIFLS
jgi:hypothetical protein